MSIQHHIDNEAQLIIVTWEGDVNDFELIETITKYQKDIQSNPEYVNYNEVLDFSKVSSANFKPSTTGLKYIGEIASRTDQTGANKKLAIIVNSNKAFVKARIYIAYRSFTRNSNKEVRIFMNQDRAYKWAKNTT
jgi:hypothetical protein